MEEDQTKVLIETHPDGSQTANGYPIRTAFQASLLRKKEEHPVLYRYVPEHHLGDIVYIQNLQFKITGIAFYPQHISYLLFGVVDGTPQSEWYTHEHFTTTPGKKIGFEVNTEE